MTARCFPEDPEFEHETERVVWAELRDQLPDDAALFANLSLTDRNAWQTGVVEDRETPVFRVSPPVSTPGAHPSAPGVPSGGVGTGSTLSPAR